MVIVSVRLVPKKDCKLEALHKTKADFGQKCEWILEISGLQPNHVIRQTFLDLFEAPGGALHKPIKSPDKKDSDFYAEIPTATVVPDMPISGAMLYVNKLQECGFKIISSFPIAKEGGGTSSLVWTLQDIPEPPPPSARPSGHHNNDGGQGHSYNGAHHSIGSGNGRDGREGQYGRDAGGQLGRESRDGQYGRDGRQGQGQSGRDSRGGQGQNGRDSRGGQGQYGR